MSSGKERPFGAAFDDDFQKAQQKRQRTDGGGGRETSSPGAGGVPLFASASVAEADSELASLQDERLMRRDNHEAAAARAHAFDVIEMALDHGGLDCDEDPLSEDRDERARARMRARQVVPRVEREAALRAAGIAEAEWSRAASRERWLRLRELDQGGAQHQRALGAVADAHRNVWQRAPAGAAARTLDDVLRAARVVFGVTPHQWLRRSGEGARVVWLVDGVGLHRASVRRRLPAMEYAQDALLSRLRVPAHLRAHVSLVVGPLSPAPAEQLHNAHQQQAQAPRWRELAAEYARMAFAALRPAALVACDAHSAAALLLHATLDAAALDVQQQAAAAARVPDRGTLAVERHAAVVVRAPVSAYRAAKGDDDERRAQWVRAVQAVVDEHLVAPAQQRHDTAAHGAFSLLTREPAAAAPPAPARAPAKRNEQTPAQKRAARAAALHKDISYFMGGQ